MTPRVVFLTVRTTHRQAVWTEGAAATHAAWLIADIENAFLVPRTPYLVTSFCIVTRPKICRTKFPPTFAACFFQGTFVLICLSVRTAYGTVGLWTGRWASRVNTI